MKGPVFGKDNFVATGAIVRGDVVTGDEVGIWFNAVIRSDNRKIRIGKGTNIQDNAVIHVEHDSDTVIGEYVTIGHGAIVHGCTVGDNTTIGMGATVMSYAKIGKNCIVGAGALVTMGTEVPDGSLVMGAPAKVRRMLTEEEIQQNAFNAQYYINETKMYSDDNILK